jgi:cell shape-determining protein MreC
VKALMIVMCMVAAGFMVVETAAAASISTRVRILEAKVKKHDRKIRANTHAIEQQKKRLTAGLAKVNQLEKRVDHLQQMLQRKQRPKQDKRYAFP